MNDMLANLRTGVKMFEPPVNGAPLLVFVRRLELAPKMYSAIPIAEIAATSDGIRMYGIEIAVNAALPEHHAFLRFADGRVGVWDLRTNDVKTWSPTQWK